MSWIKDTLPPLGIDFASKPIRIINREAANRRPGDVMQLDLSRRSPATTTNLFGSPSSCWVNAVDCGFNAVGGKGEQCWSIYVALTATIRPGEEGMAMLWGNGVGVLSSGDAVVAGDVGAVTNNLVNFLEFSSGGVAPAAQGKGVAIAQVSSPGSAVIPTLFNGFHFWCKP